MVTGHVASYISIIPQEAAAIQLSGRESLKMPPINPAPSFTVHIIVPDELHWNVTSIHNEMSLGYFVFITLLD